MVAAYVRSASPPDRVGVSIEGYVVQADLTFSALDFAVFQSWPMSKLTF
ncbi:hypothetical protein LPJGGPFB_04909 [Ensifer adhaerens]|nr:hypothetical protein [Ensifer adhaerens]